MDEQRISQRVKELSMAVGRGEVSPDDFRREMMMLFSQQKAPKRSDLLDARAMSGRREYQAGKVHVLPDPKLRHSRLPNGDLLVECAVKVQAKPRRPWLLPALYRLLKLLGGGE